MQTTSGTPLTGPAGRSGGGSGRRTRRGRVGVLAGVALAVLALDIISKVIVVATLSDRAPVRLLGGFLTLRVARNAGAAFSIGTSLTVVFSAIAIGVIIFILRASRRMRSVAWAIALGLLLGGATGNLVDRLARHPGPLRGDVVDWIQVPHWPVFNLADSAIVCGAILAVLLSARGVRIDAGWPVRSEPVRSEPVRSEPVRSEPVRSEPVPEETGPEDTAGGADGGG